MRGACCHPPEARCLLIQTPIPRHRLAPDELGHPPAAGLAHQVDVVAVAGAQSEGGGELALERRHLLGGVEAQPAALRALVHQVSVDRRRQGGVDGRGPDQAFAAPDLEVPRLVEPGVVAAGYRDPDLGDRGAERDEVQQNPVQAPPATKGTCASRSLRLHLGSVRDAV